VSALGPGLKIAKEVLDINGKVLLGRGALLTSDNISYLSFIGLKGVYVEDEEDSKSTDLSDLIRPEIRETAAWVVKDFFSRSMSGNIPSSEKKIFDAVDEVVNIVLQNKDVVINLNQVKAYDQYTYFHSVDVGTLAGIIGAKRGLSKEELEELVTAGFLHDVGKVFISPDIINAPRRLNNEERIKMMEHPRLGYEYLKRNYNFSDTVIRTVYEHHEWYNGMGYPNRRSKEGLHIFSRILKAADVYDAMTTKRPYHPPYLPSEVMEYIMGRCGMEFDPGVVELMARELCVYPVGCEVELSDGRRAVVIENHHGLVLRPTVEDLDSKELIDLMSDREAWKLTIVKLML
jgi:putative nucleotidyltransferase with HDIG domain